MPRTKFWAPRRGRRGNSNHLVKKREYGAQHFDPWGLVWLIAGDEAFDGRSQRDPGLPEEDGRPHQPRRHRGSHQAAPRGGAPRDLPGKRDATTTAEVDLSRYDLVGLAMQEPQYTNHAIRVLMIKIATAGLPCLSIMNMPPLPYLKRIPSLADMD